MTMNKINIAELDKTIAEIGAVFPTCMTEHFDESSAVYSIRFDFSPLNDLLAKTPDDLKPIFADFIAKLKTEMRAELERFTGAKGVTLQ
jgi:hypothetical protein